MRRGIALATCCLVVLLGGIAAVIAHAQETVRTVVITIGPRSVAIQGAEGLPAGPTRIEIRERGRGQTEGVLVALKPGRTLADLRRALPRAARGPAPLKPIITFEAGSVPPAGTAYATTIDLRPGTTYVAANVPERLRNTRFATFSVGTTPTTAVRPTPVATVGVYDYAYGMPSTLPRQGVVRFENRGERVHIAVAFPVRRGVSRTAAVRAVLRNQERRFGRLLDERAAFEPLGVVGPGTVNDVELSFPRRGDWLFVCFIRDGEPGNPAHYTIGMVKPFRVQ